MDKSPSGFRPSRCDGYASSRVEILMNQCFNDPAFYLFIFRTHSVYSELINSSAVHPVAMMVKLCIHLPSRENPEWKYAAFAILSTENIPL